MAIEHPFVSVIVPVYNGASTLPACIEALLAQDYPSSRYEVLIVDNGSTDETREVIDRYPVRYVPEFDVQSSYAARNTGIRSARGSILAFTDADCIADPGWLQNAVPAFQDQQVGCVAGGIRGYDPETWLEEYLVESGWLSEHSALNHHFLPYPQTANAVYRRSVFEQVGLFEENWLSGGDADLAWRMQLELDLRIEHVPEAVVFHKHRTSLAALYRQCKKWGYGQAALSEKYGERALQVPFRSPWRTLVFLTRTGLSFGVRLLSAWIQGKEFSRRAEYLVNLTVRAGMQVGLLYGRFRRPGRWSAGW